MPYTPPATLPPSFAAVRETHHDIRMVNEGGGGASAGGAAGGTGRLASAHGVLHKVHRDILSESATLQRDLLSPHESRRTIYRDFRASLNSHMDWTIDRFRTQLTRPERGLSMTVMRPKDEAFHKLVRAFHNHAEARVKTLLAPDIAGGKKTLEGTSLKEAYDLYTATLSDMRTALDRHLSALDEGQAGATAGATAGKGADKASPRELAAQLRARRGDVAPPKPEPYRGAGPTTPPGTMRRDSFSDDISPYASAPLRRGEDVAEISEYASTPLTGATARRPPSPQEEPAYAEVRTQSGVIIKTGSHQAMGEVRGGAVRGRPEYAEVRRTPPPPGAPRSSSESPPPVPPRLSSGAPPVPPRSSSAARGTQRPSSPPPDSPRGAAPVSGRKDD